MAATATARARFTVTGPDTERTYPAGNTRAPGGPALSAAIAFASRAHGEATFYVRDADGTLYGHVVRDTDGNVTVHRAGKASR
jgi:hypothetical protein